MNIFYFIASLITSTIIFSSYAYANVSMAADIILTGIAIVIVVNLFVFIVVVISVKKINRYFSKKSPKKTNPNFSTPSIRDLIHKNRTTQVKILCSAISFLSFLIMTLSYSLVILIPEVVLHYVHKIGTFIIFFIPSVYLLSFLLANFLALLNQYYTRKIIHFIDFKEFKKMQKENGIFIMPSSQKNKPNE